MKKAMTRPFVAGLLLVLALCLCACGKTYKFEGVTIPLPDGFTVDDSTSIPIAYGPNYPSETDNINFVKTGADNISNYTRETFEQIYRTYGFSSISFNAFEKKTISGTDAIYMSFDGAFNGVPIKTKQVMIFMKDKTITVTYTSSSGKYDAAFDKSIAGIKV